MTTLVSESPETTQKAAEELATTFVGGELVYLEGAVGAGKTVFAQGLGRGLGVDEPVTSPSFAIVASYRGRLDLHHVDLYRLAGQADVADLGLHELVGPSAVVVVEWADRAPGVLGSPTVSVVVELDPIEPNRRRITVTDGRPASGMMQ